MTPSSKKSMPNKIVLTQNEPLQLRRLAAQRHLYGKAKKVLAAQMMLTGPITILAVLIAWQWPQARFATATFAIAVLLFDTFVLSAWQSGLRDTASKIQEAFDCDVLEMPWPKQKAGKSVAPETEVEHCIKYTRVAHKNYPLTDWYSIEVSQLPLQLARIVCQRSNCAWDGKQRRLYVLWALVIFFSVIAITTLVAIASAVSLQDFAIIVGVALLPFMRMSIQHIRDHRDASLRAEKLRDDAKELFSDACRSPDDATLPARSRALQDEILDGRKRNLPLFDWVFRRLRTAMEVEMNMTAKQLAQEMLASR